MLVLTERPRRANPNRAAADFIGGTPGSVWTQQTSQGPRQVMITDERGSFVPVAALPAPSVWEQVSAWVENEVPGGWLTAAGGAAVVGYLLFVPPRPKTRTVVE